MTILRSTKWFAAALFALLGTGELLLFVTGKRFLVSERLSTPGRPLFVDGYGDLGEMTSPKWVCRYFNGRRTIIRVFHQSPSDIMGRDSCPVWLSND
jgi:hypothetical protein